MPRSRVTLSSGGRSTQARSMVGGWIFERINKLAMLIWKYLFSAPTFLVHVLRTTKLLNHRIPGTKSIFQKSPSSLFRSGVGRRSCLPLSREEWQKGEKEKAHGGNMECNHHPKTFDPNQQQR